MTIQETLEVDVFTPQKNKLEIPSRDIVMSALKNPIGIKPLHVLAKGKKKVLIVTDDIARPTPVKEFVDLVLSELFRAGVEKNHIEFLMALGTHRPMTRAEMAQKLGEDIVQQYNVHNHAWNDPESLTHIGETDQGVPVVINKLVSQADLVIGIGAIMPIEVCGFTGGGKILIPGVCGEVTNSEMHWTRVDVPSEQIIGKRDNPIRKSIDDLARIAGLDFIVNVIMNNNGIVGAVAGDMVEAHRKGCEIAEKIFGVEVPHEYDIVIADGYPFDIEFWQVNKAVDTAGEFVKKGGVVIMVSPCYEGFSQSHPEIQEYGYRKKEQIRELIGSGRINHKVVGVHMMQVGAVAVEKAKLILVSSGISKENAEKVGFTWASSPQEAFDQALKMSKDKPTIAVLEDAARILPLKKHGGTK